MFRFLDKLVMIVNIKAVLGLGLLWGVDSTLWRLVPAQQVLVSTVLPLLSVHLHRDCGIHPHDQLQCFDQLESISYNSATTFQSNANIMQLHFRQYMLIFLYQIIYQ